MNTFRQRLTRVSLFTTLALLALLSLQWYARTQAAASLYFVDEDVRWTGLVNTTATGNTIRKTAGANDGTFDGSGVSQQTIANNGYLEFKATGADVERVAGLTDTPNDRSLNSIDFFINLSEGGIAEFRERGNYIGDTAYVNGDTFRITLVNGHAEYSKNGAVLSSGNVTIPGAVTAIASFGLLNGEISAARLGNVNGGTCTYTLTQTSANVGAAASGLGIDVTTGAGCPWTAVSNAAWITPGGPTSFTGSGTASFNIAANTGAARTGTITIAGFTFTVNQAAAAVVCTYSISPSSATVQAAGANTGVNVLAPAGCAWTARSNATWLTINSGASGTGNGAVSIAVAANTGAARTGTATIAGQTFTVTQGSGLPTCTYSLSPPSTNVPATGGSGTVTVNTQAGCAWSASPVASWLQVTSIGSGTGTGTFNYLAAANAGAARTGVIAVNGQNFTVNQAGATTGGNVQDVIWTGLVNAATTGGTIRKTGGRDDGTYDGSGISVQSFSNNGYYEFTVGGADVERVTGLTDTPNNREFTSFDFYVNVSEGGIAEFRERGVYLGDTPYNLGDVFRITVENGRARYSRNGNVLTYGNATTTAPLKAIAAFGALNGEVTQAKLGGLTGGCSYAITPTVAAAPASGATGSVAVATPGGCAWTATSNASWLTVTSGASGNGNGTVAYTVGANTTAQRTGTLTIAGQTFTVTQAAATASSPNVTWTQLVNLSLIGQTLRKTGGADDGSYDGSAVSREVLSGGTGYVEFTVSGPYVRRSIGLSRNYTAGNESSLDYEINMSDSNIVEFRYRGQYLGDATYKVGDVIRIAVENGRVVAYVNAKAFAETTARPTYPLQVWASFSRLGGEATGAKLYTGQLPVLQQRRTPTGQTGDDPLNQVTEPDPAEDPRQQ